MMRRLVCIRFEYMHPHSGPPLGLQDMFWGQKVFGDPISCLIAQRIALLEEAILTPKSS